VGPVAEEPPGIWTQSRRLNQPRRLALPQGEGEQRTGAGRPLQRARFPREGRAERVLSGPASACAGRKGGGVSPKPVWLPPRGGGERAQDGR
jgi:hypothetical protein